jgi:adenylate cyclase
MTMPIAAAAQPVILVVDDDGSLREMLEDYVATLGYRPIGAGSAEAALELIEASAPDLILTDVHMAAMTGIDLCARLKADPRFQMTPVVLLTAVSDLKARVAGLAAGADDFFSKPCDLVELGTRIKSLLRLKRLQDQVESRNRVLRTLLGRHVSEDVATEILRDPEKHLALAGEKREVTMLFGDLRGFTPLSDSLAAEDIVTVLNAYLNEVVEAVFASGGTLDKFRGDGIMAIFGAPVAHADDPLRAVRCALQVQKRLKQLRFKKFPDLRLHMGIGINTGSVIAGTIGSARRMDYTVIGTEVNLAQRFEASAGPGQILITRTTYGRVKRAVHVRTLGPLRVTGRSVPVEAYDVLGLKAAKPAMRDVARRSGMRLRTS